MYPKSLTQKSFATHRSFHTIECVRIKPKFFFPIVVVLACGALLIMCWLLTVPLNWHPLPFQMRVSNTWVTYWKKMRAKQELALSVAGSQIIGGHISCLITFDVYRYCFISTFCHSNWIKIELKSRFVF